MKLVRCGFILSLALVYFFVPSSTTKKKISDMTIKNSSSPPTDTKNLITKSGSVNTISVRRNKGSTVRQFSTYNRQDKFLLMQQNNTNSKKKFQNYRKTGWPRHDPGPDHWRKIQGVVLGIKNCTFVNKNVIVKHNNIISDPSRITQGALKTTKQGAGSHECRLEIKRLIRLKVHPITHSCLI
jgi:hypothetical protein